MSYFFIILSSDKYRRSSHHQDHMQNNNSNNGDDKMEIYAVALGFPVTYSSSYPSPGGHDHRRYQLDS